MKRTKQMTAGKKRLVSLLLFAGVCLGFGWYLGIYRPITQRIQAADTISLENQIALEQMRSDKLQRMQEEIDKNRTTGTPVVPSYNNLKQEIDEFNQIFSKAYRYEIQFSEPEADGMNIRRMAAVTMQAENYDAAVSLLTELVQGPYRITLQNISISGSMADKTGIQDGGVSVSFQMIYYETRYDAETEEGLIQTKNEEKEETTSKE